MTKAQLRKYKERRERILRMAGRKGISQVQIAAKFRVSPARINQILAEERARPKDSW